MHTGYLLVLKWVICIISVAGIASNQTIFFSSYYLKPFVVTMLVSVGSSPKDVKLKTQCKLVSLSNKKY